jgi:hypothetical protein
MASASQSGSEAPRHTPDAASVREQLNRLLTHSLFSHSRRYPIFLAYIVEQTLLGNAGDLKERTIGIEAFGREPEYDVNLDPVVRTSAAEVRKRLIQYYYDHAHDSELLIELSSGSYVPIFRYPDHPRIEIAEAPATPEAEYPRSRGEILLQAQESAIFSAELPRQAAAMTRSRWAQLAALLLLTLLVGFGLGHYRPLPPPSNMERFWQPITSSRGPVTYCMGEPNSLLGTYRSPVAGVTALDPSLAGRLNMSDVLTLSRSIVPLAPRSGAFRVLLASQTTLSQLREGPVVLIGAFSNQWTLRVTQNLRFGFELRNGVGILADRRSSPHFDRGLEMDATGHKIVRDYALVARIHDGTTGQPVIVIAGILGEGTEAAGEVLYNPVYLDSLLQKAPKNWDSMNMEALIETNVIENHPGPPTILAVETW